MATFTALAKILSLENYYNAKIAGLGENFIPRYIDVHINLEYRIAYMCVKFSREIFRSFARFCSKQIFPDKIFVV